MVERGCRCKCLTFFLVSAFKVSAVSPLWSDYPAPSVIEERRIHHVASNMAGTSAPSTKNPDVFLVQLARISHDKRITFGMHRVAISCQVTEDILANLHGGVPDSNVSENHVQEFSRAGSSNGLRLHSQHLHGSNSLVGCMHEDIRGQQQST